MSYRSENRLLASLSKFKIKNPLFNILVINLDKLNYVVLRNNKKVKLNSNILYIKNSIVRYNELITNNISQSKSSFYRDEREKLKKTLVEREMELIHFIDEYLSRSKEIVLFCNDDNVHYLVDKGNLHSLIAPAISYDNSEICYYYINGTEYTEEQWNKDIQVRKYKIKKLLDGK